MNNSYAILLVAFLCFGGTLAVDTAAVTQCRSLHHTDADQTSAFVNSRCQLNCYIHGKLWPHIMSQGSPCPLAPSGVCQNGICVARAQNGHIDIEITSASLSSSANAYATVCIANSTAIQHLPITDRSKCVSCATQQAPYGNYPVWNAVCAGSGKYLFSSESRVSIEVWDHHGPQNNEFLGGVTLTIPQLLQHGDNHRAIHLAMTGGKMSGQVNTVITWTKL